MLTFFWGFVAADVLRANPECLRCHGKDKLEVAHMLSVEIIESRYPHLMSKYAFEMRNGWNAETGLEWTQEIETAWIRQAAYNRDYMRMILDKRNLRVLCRGCHDYSHARENLQHELKELSEYGPGSIRRLIVEAQLKSLDALNTPELIRVNGYRPYAQDRQLETRIAEIYKAQKVELALRKAEELGIKPLENFIG